MTDIERGVTGKSRIVRGIKKSHDIIKKKIAKEGKMTPGDARFTPAMLLNLEVHERLYMGGIALE